MPLALQSPSSTLITKVIGTNNHSIIIGDVRQATYVARRLLCRKVNPPIKTFTLRTSQHQLRQEICEVLKVLDDQNLYIKNAPAPIDASRGLSLKDNWPCKVSDGAQVARHNLFDMTSFDGLKKRIGYNWIEYPIGAVKK